MKKIQKFLLLLTVVNVFFVGCQEELNIPDQDAMRLPGNQTMLPIAQLTEQDQQLVTFTKSLAKSLKDISMRRYIKQEALVDLDGENNMLYELIKFQKVGELFFSDHLLANMPINDAQKISRQDIKTFFSEDFEAMPLLSIGVPVHLEKWNIDDFVPMVAVELSDYDDQQSQYIRAYDAAGDLHFLSLKETPEVPTVVVRMNERIESLGKKAGKLMYQASDFVPQTKEFSRSVRKFGNHILSRVNYSKVTDAITARICGDWEAPPGCEEAPPSGGGSGTTSCNTRSCKPGNEKLYAIKFNSDSDFKDLESWTDRNLELYTLIFAKDLPLVPFRENFYAHYNSFQNCSGLNCWAVEYRPNRDLQFQWNPNLQGQYIAFRWMEYDNGTTRTSSFSYKPCDTCANFTNSYSYTDQDDQLGDKLVQYTSVLYAINKLDKFYFKLYR